jgi:transposase
MKASQREVLMDPRGWKRMGSRKTFNLNELGPEDEQTTFYKESEWLNEEGIHQRFLVTYSLKYKYYLQSIRAHQIHREDKKIKTYSQFNKKGPHDPKRFVKEVRVTESGEVADKIHLGLDQERIDHEAKFDGFYCISTDYECSPEMLIKIIARRQKIEETFRIMKDEMKARPVYLQRDNRIKAHFLTCFLAMLVYRILEDKLHHQYTVDEIIQTLKEMNVLNQKDLGYQPCYTRTRLTDSLHEAFGFRTDWEFITGKRMKEIIKKSHNPK